METKKIKTIADLATFIAINFPADSWTEHEGLAYRDVEVAFLISSNIKNFEDRKQRSGDNINELRRYIKKNYPILWRDIASEIVLDKLNGCQPLAKLLLAERFDTSTEFGEAFEKIRHLVRIK